MRRLICIALCLGFLFGCANSNQKVVTDVYSLLDKDYASVRAQGNVAMGQGDYDQALEHFLQVWQSNRDDFNLTYAIAICYSEIGEAELAGRFLLETLKYFVHELSMEQIAEALYNVYEDEAFAEYREKAKEHNEALSKTRGEISYITTTTKNVYRTVLPDDFDKENEYSILIFMHGHGGSPFNFAPYSPLLQERDIIFVQPQGPYPWDITLGRNTSFSWGIMDYSAETDPDDISWNHTMNFILALSHELKAQYNVKSLYLSGFSQGGGQTMGIGLRNQDMFDGLICFGGALWSFEHEEELPSNQGIPVLVVHGENDTVVSYEQGIEIFERLESLGYEVDLQTFEGGHNIPREEFIKALEWIKKTK